MIKLYRGVIDILLSLCSGMDEQFTKHIRANVTQEELDFDQIGATGFWNLLLEIIFLLFSRLIFLIGIAVVAAFTVIFFPLQAAWWGVSSILNHRATFVSVNEQIEPKLDKK